MNREILFRGKRVDNGEWLYGDLARSTSSFEGKEYNHVLIGTDWDYEEVIPETIGQFTGLTDKNGTKIFEWDILSCINPNDGEIYTTGFIASLINGITFTNTKLTRELAMYECEWPDELQITSNIHDNPTT